MTERNVGTRDALARAVASQILLMSAPVAVAANRSLRSGLYALVAIVTAYLLLKSVLTRRCPLHEQAGIDTTR